jgi:V-type H+-transporting ATPase subunit a
VPIQILLLLLAMVDVLWMLFPKPFILKKLHQEVLHKDETCFTR